MKRLSLLVITGMLSVLCGLLLLSVHASAAVLPFDGTCSSSAAANESPICKDKNNTSPDLNPFSGNGGVLMRATKLLVFVVGAASILIIIFGGIKYITSDGDANSISSAKSTVQYAFIGLIIALAAQGIIVFIVNIIN
jgi:hypothetical protein